MRFAACIGVAIVCAVVLGGSANSARTDGGAAWTLTPVADGQKLLRVDVSGDTLFGVRVRGTDFTLTGIKSIHASGGPAPQCSVSGSPATLACDSALPGGISLFIQLTTSGSGGAYEIALLFSPGDTSLLYVPSNQTAPPAPIGGSFGMVSPSVGRVTFHNATGATLQQFEFAPVGFRVASVQTADCAVTEGGGIACQGELGPDDLGVITFTTDPFIGQASAALVAHGSSAAGIAFVQAGDPCPDLRAALAGFKVRAAAVNAQIARVKRELAAVDGALGRGKGFAKARKQLKAARNALAALMKTSRTLARDVQREQADIKSCESNARPGAPTACGNEWSAAAQGFGVAEGLAGAVANERRVATKARAALVLVKKAGGPGSRAAIAHLNALIALPGKTQSALARARSQFAGARSAFTACEAALAQL